MSRMDTVDVRENGAGNYSSHGLVYQISREGLVFVYVPGTFPDPYIDQRTKKPEERYAVGDFVAFVPPEEGNPIRQHGKSDPILKVEVNDGSILVETQVSFFPSSTNHPDALAGVAAWSPDFQLIVCKKKLSEKPVRDHMYMAWVERCETPVKVMDTMVSWQLSDKKPLSEPLTQCHLAEAPWAHRGHRRNNNNIMNSCFAQNSRSGRMDRREILKEYTKDNYEGVVVRTIQDQAIVWSAGIPITEVSFMYGARDNLKVGDWIQFNCEASRYTQHGCLLEGKKYVIISEIVPVYVMDNNVMANLEIHIPSDDSEMLHFARGIICVKSPIFNQIQFPAGVLEESYRGRTLKIRVMKLMKPSLGMSSWKFVKVLSDEEFSTIPAQPQRSSSALASNSQDGTRSLQQPCAGQQQQQQGISGDDMSNELYGIIIAIEAESSDVFIWTNKLGDVLWNSNASAQPFQPVVGRWLKFSSYSVDPLRGGVSSICAVLHGVPEPIAQLLPTRVRNAVVQLQTEVTSIEPFHYRIQKAQSELLGAVLMRNDMVLGYHCETITFGDKFLVWVEHTQSKPAWNVIEVVEKLHDSSVVSRANNLEAESVEEDSDTDEYDDTFEDLLVGVNGVSVDDNTTPNVASNNLSSVNESNVRGTINGSNIRGNVNEVVNRHYESFIPQNQQQQYQQRPSEQGGGFSAPYQAPYYNDRNQQFANERGLNERSGSEMCRPARDPYGGFQAARPENISPSSAMAYAITAAPGRYARLSESQNAAAQREYAPLREQQRTAQYSRGYSEFNPVRRQPPRNERRYLDGVDFQEADDYGYSSSSSSRYGNGNTNAEWSDREYVSVPSRRPNQRSLQSDQRERMGGRVLASDLGNYNEQPASRQYSGGFRSQQWWRQEETEPTRNYTRYDGRDRYDENRYTRSRLTPIDQRTRPVERAESGGWVQQQRRQAQDWVSSGTETVNAPNSSSRAAANSQNNSLGVPIFGAERPVPLVQRTATSGNAQQIQRQAQQIQPNQLAQNQSEGQRRALRSPQATTQIPSAVQITDENDPLGPPVFGAQRPIPLSSLLSPPADSNEEEGLSEHGLPAETSAVPAPARATATRMSDGQSVSDEMSPEVEECAKQLWRLASNHTNGPPGLYSELARIAVRRGWDMNGGDSARR